MNEAKLLVVIDALAQLAVRQLRAEDAIATALGNWSGQPMRLEDQLRDSMRELSTPSPEQRDGE